MLEFSFLSDLRRFRSSNMFFRMFTVRMMLSGKNTTGRPLVEEIALIMESRPMTKK